MPKLRTLSGQELIQIFSDFGFQPLTPRGSHVKLRRVLASGGKQSLTIVLHNELDKGTLRAIYRQALRLMPTTKHGPAQISVGHP